MISAKEAGLNGKVSTDKEKEVYSFLESLKSDKVNINDVEDAWVDIKKLIVDPTTKGVVEKYLNFLRISKLKFVEKLLKYGSFGANIAKAQNSEEAEQAIEAIALPVGSASIKRNSNFNISLNSYCGLFGGLEIIKNVNNDSKKISKDPVNAFGLTVPVGIAFSRGSNRKASHSIILNLIDIGAIAAFRFKDDTTKATPTVELRNIISPGLFYSYGFPKVPISINLGYQLGPLLREVKTDKVEVGSMYHRFSISVCVDIPLLNLYTKSSQE